MRTRYSALKRRKSTTSQAASISAWCAVFDWPSIVAALSVDRHGPDSSSAARRKTATRSCHGVRDHSVCASRHRYAVEGWGVGELIVSYDLVLAHDLPDPALSRDGADAETKLSRSVASRVRAHLAGTETDYDDVELDLSWCTAFQRELA